jgi:predicted SnoaL-like aldol condensation-catalyzing enzyme
MTDVLERNKRTVIAFYDLMFNQCQPREAVERYSGAEYIQHNPGVGNSKEAFIAYFERMAREYPASAWSSFGLLPRAITWRCIAGRNGPVTTPGPASIFSV